MNDVWAYPYRLGIGLFIGIGTIAIMALLIGIAIWLERSFKNDRER